MMIETVRANTGDREGKWIGLLILLILGFAAITIPLHQAETKHGTVLAHQVLVTEIDKEDLAMLAELKLAHEEIRDLYADEGMWVDIEMLEQEWISPFVQDQSWKRKGQHQWSLDTRGYYLGQPKVNGTASSFLLNANSISPEIWIKTSNSGDTVTKSSTYDVDTLQSLGWKQIVNEANDQHTDSHHSN